MILETCPFCHRPFEARAIAREEVDASDLTREQLTRIMPRGRGVLGPRGPRNPETVLTYKATYKCHHCGKEWSKIETKDVGIPKEYSETGFD